MFLNQLIIFYFVHIAKLNSILFLHCWTEDSLLQFAQLSSNEPLYTQFLGLNEVNFLEDYLEKNVINHQLTKLGIYMDINCNQSSDVLYMANQKRIFTDRNHWLIYDHSFNITQLHKRFAEVELYLNTELTYVKHSSNLQNFILYDVYNKAKHLGSKLNVTIDQQIRCNETNCYVKRYLSDLHLRNRLQHRRYLTGLTLRVSTPITFLPITTPEPQIVEFLSSFDNIFKDQFARLGYQTNMLYKDILDCNFTYTYRDRWTDSDVTGGMIGDLLNGTADIAATAFLFTTGRAKYFKLLAWYCSFRSICMFRNPLSTGAELRVKEFLQPFSWTVWLMFSAMLLSAGFLLWLTFHLERRLSSSSIKPSLLTSCLLSFGAACIQGAWLMPRSTGGRMVFYVVMLTCFLMYNYYTSVVVSTLLGAPPKSNIRTIQQLADSNMEVAVEPTIYTKVYVETSTYPDVRSLYLRKIASSHRDPKQIWLPSEQGVLKMRDNPGFVYIAEAASAYGYIRQYLMPHEICALNEILLRDESNTYSIALKTSSFAELLKLSQLRSLETGVHFKHFRYWVRNKLHCYQSNVVVVVGMDTAGPLFLLLFSAYIICLFVLGMEILWHRRQQRAVRH